MSNLHPYRHLVQLKAAPLILLGALSLFGCGYELRGIHQNTAAVPLSVSLAGDERALKDALGRELAMTGFVMTTNQGEPNIEIKDVQLRRYELVGVLTEIRLLLTANVTYNTPIGKQTHRVEATRSYQYNEAGLSSLDSKSEQIRLELNQALARRISEQYRSLNLKP
ncbi:MAG: hypothetical protein Q4B88_01135 [Moraxella sp.]|nr:hypothetical protein [Moraxella sp.]